MGLLDGMFDSEGGRLGLGLLAAGSARGDGAGAGQRLMEAVGSVDAWKKAKAAEEMQRQHQLQQHAYQQMQMQSMQAQMQERAQQAEDAKALRGAATSAFITPEQAMGQSMGPMPDGSSVPQVQSGFNDQRYIQNLQQLGRPLEALQHQAAIQKDDAPVKLGQGDQLFSGRASGYKPLASVPAKPEATPAALQEYLFAVNQGEKRNYTEWSKDQKRSGANNISMKVDAKMGESLAGQVGPMAKDSRIQTQGAVKMFDSADRLEKALDSNKVTSGPLATQIQTAKQLIQVVGGGNDDGIRQTRQAIKSLAQMAVEARKQLQGQGQVTENEAAAVAKADAGDLNDLTTGELRDLVVLTKRAAHYQAKSHTDLLNNLGGKTETQGLVPFYGVQGLDPLLKHSPALPQIGGGVWGINQVGQ